MAPSRSLEEISKLEDQIAALTATALNELRMRRNALQSEIESLDKEIEKLTGKPVRPRSSAPGLPAKSPRTHTPGKRPDLQELKALLAAAPNKTISLRKEGYDVGNVKVLAEANPHLLKMGGKGAWPEVTLLK